MQYRLPIKIADHKMKNVAERFWSKVQKGAPDECWPYMGSRDGKGYGTFGIGTRVIRAHRVAFYLATGLQPDEAVRHTCDNPPCCNNAHLLNGSVRENNLDMFAKGRHLINGRRKGTLGENNGKAILSPPKIELIRELRQQGLTMKAIGRQVGVTRFAVSKVLRGITWNHV